jgi:sterol desaturase/sphingolipid hydroxylase (fatty acid hydroxylase superfamily)
MPLLVSIPLATIFYFLFVMILGVYGVALFSGFVIGYVAYDSIHYATHHFPMRSKVAHFIKEYHLRHHYQDEHTAYGVSNPLWDYVFGTVPDRLKENKDVAENM